MSRALTAEYKTFLKEIKARIYKAQYDALKAVNKELIQLYWDIGKSIVAKQEKLGWGKAIVETLAKDLQKEFAGIHATKTGGEVLLLEELVIASLHQGTLGTS